jgi:hypothetical protein
MNSSHASAVGSRLGFLWRTMRAIISCGQFALPVMFLFDRFLKRPPEVIGKLPLSHSCTSIAVAVGVVVTADNPSPPPLVGRSDDMASQ